MPSAVYTPEARDDIDQAYADYERHLIGLGDRFLRALADRIQVIEGSPALYGEVIPGIRAALLRRFPFVVYYRAEPTQVIVFAVRHGRDDPRIWQRRAARP
jgi:plasmid stabilization system protein ParE